MANETNKDEDVMHLPEQAAVAFVGCVVPDENQYQTRAFSRAGNMFQLNLLYGLWGAGCPVAEVVTPVPIPSFPSERRWFVSSKCYRLGDEIQVRSLAFPNLPVLKQLGIGVGVFKRILSWGWKNRKNPRKVILAYNLAVPPGVFTQVAAWLIGAKVVALLCDIGIPGVIVRDTLLNRISYRMECWSIAHLDGVVSATEAVLRDYRVHVPHIRMEGGIDENVLSKPRQGSDSNRFTMVSVGTLNETNGIGLLLEAFSLLQGERYRLKIAGAGKLAETVKAAAARDPRIEYLGYIGFDEVLRAYQTADLAINARISQRVDTAYYFPSKLMEYLASGCPVLTTCAADIEKEYGEVVYLLREETAVAMADRIAEIAATDARIRNAQGIQARNYMLSNKTWSAQSKRVFELIESLFAPALVDGRELQR